MRKQRTRIYGYRGFQRRRFSLLLLTGLLVPVVLAFVAAAVFVMPRMHSHAAAANGNCSLIVPTNPLSTQGLATPYQLVATDAAGGPCNEANAAQAAFVQGAMIDPATGNISIYNPLVIDKGSQPAEAPVVPTLPKGAIVGIWFGFNGNTLTLQNTQGSLQAGKCVNGVNGSPFGQFAYCNAPAFFRAANQAIVDRKLQVPALGTAKDGRACPTVRDFSVVDMDQSDNVITSYLVTQSGQTAQMTAANKAILHNAQPLNNGSDNRLLAVALDGALGCTPWMASDLADPGAAIPALPLNELQAAAHQGAPVALVPNQDPMVLNNNTIDRNKLNAYRLGVDQALVGDANTASTAVYCAYLRLIGPRRLLLDMPFTLASPSLDPAVANSLLTFLEQRFITTYEANGLNCTKLLKQPDPVTVTRDASGVAVNGTINGIANGKGGHGTNNAPDCVVNGSVLVGCAGNTNINGQPCAFVFDANTKQVNITCPATGTP